MGNRNSTKRTVIALLVTALAVTVANSSATAGQVRRDSRRAHASKAVQRPLPLPTRARGGPSAKRA